MDQAWLSATRARGWEQVISNLQMVLVGDTYVQRSDPESAFAPVLPFTKDADIAFCNLETVIADQKYISPHDRDTRPRTDEAILPYYLKAGFNVLNLANNPSLYHGVEPFLRSLDVLDQAGGVHGGGGRNLEEARAPAVIERQGTRVAFVCRTSVCSADAPATADRGGIARFRVATAYEPRLRANDVPGSPPIIHTIPNAEDRTALEEDIKAARAQADVVVVSWHWGISPATGGVGQLVGYQTEMGRFAIDAGADLVVGHHPHVLQPIEVYKGKAIFYCIGNYVHDMGSAGRGRLMAMLVRCLVSDGQIQRLAFVPGMIDGHGPPRFVRPAEASDVVEHMRDISAPFGTKFEVGDEDVAVVLGDAQ
jgi:poly-gamma-glutamate capsule biosynthesis protein CapA/YwtB (metallophosphatase superfamily)